MSCERQRTDLPDSSASGYDQSLANFAANAGWSDQEIVNLLIAHRRTFGDDLNLNNPQKYQRTIATARTPRGVRANEKIPINESTLDPEEVINTTLNILIHNEEQENLFYHTGLKSIIRIEPNPETGRPNIVPLGVNELKGHVLKYARYFRSTSRNTSSISPEANIFTTLMAFPAG